MITKLQKYFPMIRSREAVLNDINDNNNLLDTFNTWTNEEKERFISYCTGQRGLKISYIVVRLENQSFLLIRG